MRHKTEGKEARLITKGNQDSEGEEDGEISEDHGLNCSSSPNAHIMGEA